MRWVPPYLYPDGSGRYRNLNLDAVDGPQRGSFPPAEFYNAVLDELVHGVLGKNGITPDAADPFQIVRALRRQKPSYAVAGGTANALVVTLDPPLEAYVEGMILRVRITATNTEPVTLNVNGIGANAVKHHDGSDLAAGHLLQHAVVEFIYDGYYWRVSPVLSWALIEQRLTKSLVPANVHVWAYSGVYSKPANLIGVKVRMVGGGASGGGNNGYRFGGGGGNGAFGEAFFKASDLAAHEYYFVGTGGAPVAANTAANGNPGGFTSFKDWVVGGGFGGGQGFGSAAGGAYGESGLGYQGAVGKGYAIQGARGYPGDDYAGAVPPTQLGFFGRGGGGGNWAAASIVGGSGLIILEEYLQ